MNTPQRLSSDIKLVLVGCGNMGFSLLKTWLENKDIQPENTWVVEPDGNLRARARSLGVSVVPESPPTALRPSFVILAVKPQVLVSILPLYKIFSPDAVFVSIAAGVNIQILTEGLGKAPLVRAMPNTPASIGKGSTVLYSSNYIDKCELRNVVRLMSAVGNVHIVNNEQLLDAATAISGSGPGYVFHFIDCLRNSGVALGLPPDIALSLATETVLGTGALAMSRACDPVTLEREVTSPNGTTAAALAVLKAEGACANLINNAVKAAYDRAIQFSTGEMSV